MGTYEITTEGGTYQIDTEDAPAPASAGYTSGITDTLSNVATNITSKEGWQNALSNITSKDWWLTRPSGERISAEKALVSAPLSALSGLTFGLGDEAVARGASALGAGEYEDVLGKVRGYQKDFSTEHPVADTALKMAGAVKLPVGTSIKSADGVIKTGLKSAAEGAGYGAAYGFGEGEGDVSSRLQNALSQGKTGAVVGGVFGTGIKAASKATDAITSVLSDAPRKLDLNAYGATKARIAKTYERNPEILDAAGNKQNPITVALESFKADGGGKGSMEGQALLDELGAQSNKYAAQLKEKLTEATAKQADAIVPEFNLTQKYLEKLPGAAKEDATALAQDLIKKTVNNTDGTLLSLQAEKVGLNPLIAENTYGSNANPGKAQILKYIKADLRTAIEKGYEKVTGNSSTEISKLNSELQKRFELQPLFENLRSSGEARNVVSSALQSLRTSGGMGQALIAGAATGTLAGTGAGVAAVPVAMYLQTPQGKRALANGLRSSLVQAPTSVAAALSSQATPAISAVARTAGQDTAISRVLSPSKTSAIEKTFGEDNMPSSPEKIKEVEAKIDSNPLDKTIYEIESGRSATAKNPTSSATGAFQLINSTAKALGVTDSTDIEQNYNGYLKLKEENIARFGDDPATLYAAHYLGATLLAKLLDGGRLSDSEQKKVDELKNVVLPRFVKLYQKNA